MNGYISVSDGLPSITGRYFATFSCDYYGDGVFAGEVFFRPDTKMFYLGETSTKIVERWSNLPEFPK